MELGADFFSSKQELKFIRSKHKQVFILLSPSMQWTKYVLPQFYVEILTPNVIGGGAFRRWWFGPESGTLMNGISALIKKIPESSLVPFPPECVLVHNSKIAVCNTMWAFWSQTTSLQNHEKEISVVYIWPPSLWHSVIAAQTKTQWERNRSLAEGSGFFPLQVGWCSHQW